MDQVKIGRFIKELRKEKGLTQEQQAEQSQVSRRTISRWETGSNLPDLDLLIEMADALVVYRSVGQRFEGDANDKLFFRFSKNRPRSLGANGRLTAIIRYIIGEY